MISIMIVDNDSDRLASLSSAFGGHEDLTVLSAVSKREAALKQLTLLPDILLLNADCLKRYSLPRFLRTLSTRSPKTRLVLLLTAVPFALARARALTSGVVAGAALLALGLVAEGPSWAGRVVPVLVPLLLFFVLAGWGEFLGVALRCRGARVEEAVLMGRSGKIGMMRRPGSEDRDKAYDAMRVVGIEAFAKKLVHELSGGEQQKVALARALAQEPLILLLDEPTTYLDEVSQSEIMETIHSIHHERNLTTFMVSHDSRLVEQYSDKVYLLQDGKSHLIR